MATKTKSKPKSKKTVKFSGPGKAGSAKKLRKVLDQASEGFGPKEIRSIPSEQALTVRFTEEPGEWEGYYEHWMGNSQKGYPIPCVEGDCAGCDSNARRYMRYLANAWCVDDNMMKAVKLPKSLVDQLMEFYDKYGTILDRDYDLTKKGSGQNNTSYHAVPDDPKKVKTSRFTNFDLQELLQAMLDSADSRGPVDDDDDDDYDDDDDDASPWDDDDDDDDDEDDEDDDDDEEPAPRRKKAASSKKSVKKKTTTRKKTRK